MTKYLDSKGLSYLWQKIKAELATKSDNHEHPYVKDGTVIKLGSTDATGISLVPGTDGAKDSWTIPFASANQNGVVRTGKADFTEPTGTSDWHKAPIVDGYVWYQNTLADVNTVTAEDPLTANQIVLGAGSKGIKVEGNTAIIDGVKKYTGAHISAPDLRAGAALVIAGLAAEGFTTVDDIMYIQRGYEDFELKLQGLGAHIEKVSSEKEVQKFKLKVG